jgi:drug/metabolite transporter (DMT)-like permease
MQKLLLILTVALLVEAIGVVYLSKGLKQIGEVTTLSAPEIIRAIKRGATNGNILFGVLLETIFFGALLYLLSVRDVSLIWPLTSLGFVLTALAAKHLNHEEVSPLRWCGILLIVVGAALVSWSEKQKERAATSPPSITTAGLGR